MLKKTITYVDMNGNERTEDFYFHMFAHEVTRLQAKLGYDDLTEGVKAIVKNGTLADVLSLIEDIILGSYGIKTPDGRGFIKPKAEKEKFEYSQAYAELFEELLSKPENMEAFAKSMAATTKKPTDASTIKPLYK